MQLSALKKLLQLISPDQSPADKRQSAEISEQSDNAECEENNAELIFAEDEGAECKMQDAELNPTDEDLQEITEAVSVTTDNRSHLTSSVPRAAKTPNGVITKAELKEIRELFSNMDDSEIQRLYKRVTK
jgi:hypothetical protein